MLKMIAGKGRYVITFTALVIMLFVLISGCVQDKQVAAATDSRIIPTPTRSSLPGTMIEKISNELGMLNSNGWNDLEKRLGRTRSTTLLWYHLKKFAGFEPKVVFGNQDKLKTALAIPVKMGGNATLPVIRIKGVDYYIIDPVTPAIVGEFDYGYIYDDPGSVPPGFFNNFRLNTDDIAIVEQWMRDTGVSLSYTDFSGK